VYQNEEMIDAIQVVSALVQVVGSPLKGLVRDRSAARWGDEWIDCLFDEVLVDETVFIKQAERGFELVDYRLTLRMRETFGVLTSELVDDAHVAALRQERALVHESPQGDQ